MANFSEFLTALQQRRLKKNDAIFHQGDHVEYLFVVNQGCIRMFRLTLDGTESIMYEGNAGDSFAEASLFSTHYHCEAVAVVDSILEVYRKNEVLEYLSENPAHCFDFMATLARQVQQLRTHLTLRTIKSARDRIYRYLVTSADAEGFTPVPISLKDLAKQLGLAHETFYRELSKLERCGLVERIKNGAIKICKIQ